MKLIDLAEMNCFYCGHYFQLNFCYNLETGQRNFIGRAIKCFVCYEDCSAVVRIQLNIGGIYEDPL